MTEEIKAQDGGAANTVKLVIAILLVLAGVAGFYVLSSQAAWLRWLAVVGGIVLGGVVIAFSQYGTDLKQFIALSRIELRKIVWPNRQETGMTTLVVLAFVVAAGLFFWGLDLVLAWATQALTRQGS
ncbi:MAG TPA: preprotein translocase subunit SecE [Tepidisphaeraceae bacterium]|jgi:preprotein translocase subunit SecE|nr:preprotein translocase subunit SecE [Tepidisphaeraceae bacterium]